MTFSKYQGAEIDLQRLQVRSITLRNNNALSFVYSYKTRDITKNFTLDEAFIQISHLINNEFKSALLITREAEYQFDISKKGKTRLQVRNIMANTEKSHEHNREKKRFVDIKRPYLVNLGVTTAQHELIPAMSRKWKQINKFIEVFNQALSSSNAATDTPLQVVDFGSGKGYLTFAIHDYLQHTLKNDAVVTGVELREGLVNLCNATTEQLHSKGLHFVCGDVKTHAPQHINVMIALHACDTATDYAIHYGIKAGADIIMCSPCCHKQIRPQMQSPDTLKPLLQYGVHLGQEAEMVTDGLRALLLEANGYDTKVFEFISLEHTNKNKMILATKNLTKTNSKNVLDEISSIKQFYGITEHCLETLLNQ